jgi:hypothetical protein
LGLIEEGWVFNGDQVQVQGLRRTNDRSVLGVISSDAEHARQVSYASKRKYKLDLSSLHEDHEDDENAENGILWRSLLGKNDPLKFKVALYENIKNVF